MTAKTTAPNIHLVRDKRSYGNMQGIFGSLVVPFADLELATIELPWRNNQSNMSAIPLGTYEFRPWNSKKFGKCWHITPVQGRSAILLHKGNYAGAVDHGFKTSSQGCIIIGSSRGLLNGQRAVLNSGGAMAKLHTALGHSKTYTLHITEA